jgi:hypothetical protein
MTPLAHDCPVGNTCPAVHPYTEDEVVVVGDALDRRDPAKLAELAPRIGEKEVANVVPVRLIYPDYLSIDELDAWITERFTTTCLRIENRPAYAVASDGGDFARWLAGEREPSVGAEWMDALRTERREHKYRSKVHVVGGRDLTDYERYAFDWGFSRTVDAGEDVRIFDDPGHRFEEVPDFFVLDGRHVLRMDYGDDHSFLGALPITGPDAAVYRAIASVLWSGATLFHDWWAAHPDAHRRPRAA